MFKKLANKWLKHKTKNLTLIPLFTVTFNYQKFLKDGAKDSCLCHFMHPDLRNDERLLQMIGDVIDYIRDNYDMKKFTEIIGE